MHTKEENIKKLEETGRVAVVKDGYLYTIEESVMEDGYQVNKHDPFDDIEEVIDGGLCTGSASDALEFLLWLSWGVFLPLFTINKLRIEYDTSATKPKRYFQIHR